MPLPDPPAPPPIVRTVTKPATGSSPAPTTPTTAPPDESGEAGFGTEAGYLAAHTAAVEAINAAIAGGGKGEKIAEAGEKLAEAERKAAKYEWAEATKKAGEALHEAQEALHDRDDD